MKKVSIVWIILIQWVLAFEWLHSGWGKWIKPDFMAGISGTLSTFASKTPHLIYGNFLNTYIVPNALLFGQLIRLGEIVVGVVLVLSGLALILKKGLKNNLAILIGIVCFGSAFMNLNFFLASGWSSPSTWGINLVMMIIEIILGVFYIKSRNELN